MLVELWFVMSAHCLMMLYICTKFRFVKISQRVSELLSVQENMTDR